MKFDFKIALAFTMMDSRQYTEPEGDRFLSNRPYLLSAAQYYVVLRQKQKSAPIHYTSSQALRTAEKSGESVPG